MSRLPTIGIDVGASKIIAGVVGEDSQVLDRYERLGTPSSHATGLVGALTEVVRTLSDRNVVYAVGVGIAGLVAWPEGEIDFAANHDHRKLKLRRNLASAIGCSKSAVVVENDANAAAWAEFQVGSGTTEDGLLFLAVGTGLGSGFVADGKLLRGHRGYGAEIGHLIVDRDSEVQCNCGAYGCLEALVSGIALARQGQVRVTSSPKGSLSKRFNGRPLQADTPAMISAAQAGDPEAVGIVERMGLLLGRTIGENVMSLFPAQQVVVGGGLAKLGKTLLDPMRQSCEKALIQTRCYFPPRFGLSGLGDDAIWMGAALRAQEEVVEAPDAPSVIEAPRALTRAHLAGAGRR